MFIRALDGLYKGEVREFPPHVAKDLIAAGRAVNPFHEIEDAPVQLELKAAKPATRTKQGRERGR